MTSGVFVLVGKIFSTICSKKKKELPGLSAKSKGPFYSTKEFSGKTNLSISTRQAIILVYISIKVWFNMHDISVMK